jgi:hypothetical protein
MANEIKMMDQLRAAYPTTDEQMNMPVEPVVQEPVVEQPVSAMDRLKSKYGEM